MNASDIYDLVFRSSDGEPLLIETGRLASSWIANYRLALRHAVAHLSNDEMWPKQFFQSLHYASTHLPLRYRVWCISSQATCPQTEQALAEIQFDTELYLWSSLGRIPPWTSSEPNDGKLAELCFGEASPVKQLGENTSFHQWKQEYDQCLEVSSYRWKQEVMWPRWMCMAVHFASFYLDLFQLRDIQLTAGYSHDASRNEQIVTTLSELQNHITNVNVLAIIRIWLETCTLKRDASGLPDIGTRRPRTGQFVSVRTLSEIFLLSNGPEASVHVAS